MSRNYGSEFFAKIDESSEAAAREIVPWVVQLLRPESVIDIGCGTGTWLARFRQQGVTRIVGVDGPWVPADQLRIPTEAFVATDLPDLNILQTLGQFDLALCLEVGEHIPAAKAKDLVAMLAGVAPCVMFSAAIPDQGGVDHCNEQWPRYWIDLFQTNAYVVVDCIRSTFWDNALVASWYAQNAFFFVRANALAQYEILAAAERSSSMAGKSLIHPVQYGRRLTQLRDPSAFPLRQIPKMIWRRFFPTWNAPK